LRRGPRGSTANLGHRRHCQLRDAAEFIASLDQRAGLHRHHALWFRIVEDMIEGLNDYLDSKGFKRVTDLSARRCRRFKNGKRSISITNEWPESIMTNALAATSVILLVKTARINASI